MGSRCSRKKHHSYKVSVGLRAEFDRKTRYYNLMTRLLGFNLSFLQSVSGLERSTVPDDTLEISHLPGTYSTFSSISYFPWNGQVRVLPAALQ